eukprot:scaffold56786_cov73-Phaeocystis_antarctica.AAC.1
MQFCMSLREYRSIEVPSPFESAVFLLIDRNCITEGHRASAWPLWLCRKMALGGGRSRRPATRERHSGSRIDIVCASLVPVSIISDTH